MKLIVVFFSITLLTSCSLKKEKEVYTIGNYTSYSKIDTLHIKEVEKHILKLTYDNYKDTLTLGNLTDLIGDPQIYSDVEIKTQTSLTHLKNVNGYKIDLHTKINIKNELNSDLIFLGKTKNHYFLLIWDYKYPDCTNWFSIYKLDNTKPQKIYSESVIVDSISFNIESSDILLEVRKNVERKIKK